MRKHSKARGTVRPGSARPVEDGQTGRSPARRASVRFGILFLLLVSLFTYLASTQIAWKYVHDPLCEWVAWTAVPFLALWGEASSAGSLLNLDGFSVSIVDACDGVLPSYIYLSAVIAFPSRWRDKLWGILLGLPAIFLINLIRVVTLVIVGARWPDLFEGVHIYVWQALVIALSMALWILWAERFARTASRVRA